MRILHKIGGLWSKRLVVFMIALLLIPLSHIPVNCPICSAALESGSSTAYGNVNITSINHELIDYRIEHDWCVVLFVTANYLVNITLVNEGSDTISTYLLIVGEIPQKAEARWELKQANILTVEIEGKETKKVETMVKVPMFGIPGIGDATEINFIAKSDPIEIRKHCPVCSGTGQVQLINWLQEVVK
jgi:hypothetical protein